jgi:hypothetical protein
MLLFVGTSRSFLQSRRLWWKRYCFPFVLTLFVIQVFNNFMEIIIKPCCVFLTCFSDLFDNLVTKHCLFLHEFCWCAYYRARVAVNFNDCFYLLTMKSVCEMLTVPCQKKINSVYCNFYSILFLQSIRQSSRIGILTLMMNLSNQPRKFIDL